MLVFLERDSVTSASNINIISSLYLKGAVECAVVALHVGDCLKISPKGAFYSFSRRWTHWMLPLALLVNILCRYMRLPFIPQRRRVLSTVCSHSGDRRPRDPLEAAGAVVSRVTAVIALGCSQ